MDAPGNPHPRGERRSFVARGLARLGNATARIVDAGWERFAEPAFAAVERAGPRQRRALRGLGIGVAGVLAAWGVLGYLRGPGVSSYQLSWVLTLPLVAITLVWLGARLSERAQWIGAVTLASCGAIAYLVWPSAGWWYFASAAPLPLVLMAAERGSRSGEKEPWAGGGDGPWGPP
jgi:hypothetical protein